MRKDEPGWIKEIEDDPTGRRGIWLRQGPGKLELCSGREGDDCHMSLLVGHVMTHQDLSDLATLIRHGRSIEGPGEGRRG